MSKDQVAGNKSIVWQVTGPPATGIIACTYLFVAVYGFTWAPCVRLPSPLCVYMCVPRRSRLTGVDVDLC